MILLTGFGPFLDVADNPAARVVRALDGRRLAGETVIGRVLPVSYRRGPAETVAVARRLEPRLVLGLGVARSRGRVTVERVGRPDVGAAPDVDGERPARLGAGLVRATVDVDRLAAALGAEVSDDAGDYVCNAWLYRVASTLDVPVGFVHVPVRGLDPDRLARALLTATGRPRGAGARPSGPSRRRTR